MMMTMMTMMAVVAMMVVIKMLPNGNGNGADTKNHKDMTMLLVK